jgi:hypothetical protein
MHRSEKPDSETLAVHSAMHAYRADNLNLWTFHTFSPDWFADACSEIKLTSNQNSRRREIVFAVCFVESYLFEWVGDDLLQADLERTKDYFPINDKKGIKQRWKDVIKKLVEDGLIEKSPDFKQKYWQEFHNLVDFRDGLVHANASRPDSGQIENNMGPIPAAHILNNLEPGWPTKTVMELVSQLHDAVGTPPPQ